MSTTENNTRLNLNGEKFRPRATETKISTKTTELFFYLAAVLAVGVASVLVGDKGPQTPDPFSTAQALQ